MLMNGGHRVTQQEGDAARRRRRRNPEETRKMILDTARRLLASEGIEGISVSAVAHAANINRGTAYMHFESREKLVEQTIASVSDKLLEAVYGEYARNPDIPVEEIDQVALTEGLAEFAMANPDLCRVWLMHVLSSDDPSADPFWRKYVGSLRQFAETDLAQPGVDAEVLSVLVLAGTFLWPILAHAGTLTPRQRAAASDRFTRELLRLSMHGSMRAEMHPGVARRLEGNT